MIFTTPAFVVFIALFALGWAVCPSKWRKLFLLAASYLFYASWDWRFLGLLLLSTATDFMVAQKIERSSNPTHRKRWLWASLGVNLGVLASFKYADFFLDSAAATLNTLGWKMNPTLLALTLPVGISFYTFQTLSYTIDVYRKKIPATKSWLDFAIYVAFFPQLVAGPIERASHLLPQINALALPNKTRWGDSSGWALIAIGCVKKVVIADNLAPIVDLAFQNPETSYAPALWIGTLAFALQIYGDFSGYSDIAIGLSRLLGIDLRANFRAPYGASGPREFWRRWHISLSTWLRDYLYIPLGGDRQGSKKPYRNLMITMLLGGLWHGAAWHYVIWGAYHGVLLALARLIKIPSVPRLLQRLFFFHLVCIGWIFFRAESLGDSWKILKKLFNPSAWHLQKWWHELGVSSMKAPILLGLFLGLCFVGHQMFFHQDSDDWTKRLWQNSVWVRWWAVSAMILLAILAAPEARPPFLYFQF